MLVSDGPGSLEFDDQTIFGEELADDFAIFVANREGILLGNFKTSLAQPMDECVLVNFFGVAVPMVTMNGKACFSYEITKLVGRHAAMLRMNLAVLSGPTFVISSCIFVPFCGHHSVDTTCSGWPPAQR